MPLALVALLLGAVGFIWAQRVTAPAGTPQLALLGATPTAPVAPSGIAGDYVEGEIGLPATLNPLLASSQSERDVGAVIFDGLTRVDGSGTVTPDLASEWSASNDGRTYTFKLRHDARWHDGQPFSSRDVRFTVGLIQDPDFSGDASLARFWRGILVVTPDDATVVFQLREPFAAFPSYAALPILPQHILGGVLARDLKESAFSTSPVGTGPFKFERYDRSSHTLTLRANTAYFRQPPHLATMSFHFYQDTDSLLDALRSSRIQGTGSLPASTVLLPGALPTTVTAYAPLLSGYTALFFNLRALPFSSLDVRRAISLAIDRESIVNQILPNQAAPGDGPIPRASWAFSPQATPHDPSAARQVLDAAGWTDSNGDGVLDKGGSDLSFPLLVNGDDPQRVAVATEIARELAAVNIRAQVQPVPSNEVAQALTGHQFTAAIFGWESPTGDPDCYQLWHSSQADEGLNFTGLTDTTLDRLLEQGRETSGSDKRSEIYANFQREFAAQTPAIVLYYPRFFYVVASSVHGVTAEPLVDPSGRFANVEDWFMVGAPATPEAKATP
ncbi:MAG TPA: peptide ABC transporter substrate-binding protein [Thermomicrobiaceae bacterium]|nr:peptide ABC transporter substrate-binding protein [Thermomicrobiaceae bacterium]